MHKQIATPYINAFNTPIDFPPIKLKKTITLFIDRARKTPGFSHGDIRAQLLPTQKHDITPSPFSEKQ